MAEKTVQASIEPTEVALLAGDTTEITATVQNLGQTVDQFTISIEGLDPSWYTLPVSSVALFPNDQDQLRIVIHPPESVQSSPGSYMFRVTVVSRENPQELSSTDLTIVIGPLLDLELYVFPEQAIGRRAVYQVQVRNPRDLEANVTLDATDERRRLSYRFGSRTLTVPGRGQSETSLEVRPGVVAFFGGERPFQFWVAAALSREKGDDSVKFCIYCGHEFQPPYNGIPILGPWYSRKLRQRYGSAPIYCSCCSRKIRSDSITAEAEFVRTSWTQSLPRPLRRLRHIKLRRLRFPKYAREPIIEAFQVNTKDEREFTIKWLVKRARGVKLNDDDVDPKGELVVRPLAATTYKLTAINRGKIADKTLEVSPLPLPQGAISARIGAVLSQPEVNVQAGSMPAHATLEVENLGEIVDKFTVGIEGIDESWCTRSASSVGLMPQGKGQVQLTFNPPKKQGVRAGKYPFVISVRSEADPNEATVIVSQLEILPAPECRLEVRPTRISCRRKGTFRISIINTGVSDVTCSLHASDLDEGCKFQFKTRRPEVKVGAWSSTEIKMITKPKRGSFVGEEKRYDIVVDIAGSEVTTQPANCQLHHKPFIRSWGRIIRTFIALALIAIVLYILIQLGGGWSKLIHHPGDWWETLVDKLT